VTSEEISPESTLIEDLTLVNSESISSGAGVQSVALLPFSNLILNSFPTISGVISSRLVVRTVSFNLVALSLEVKVYVTEYKILFYDAENKYSVLEGGEHIDYIDDNSPVLVNKVEDKEIYKKFINKMNKVDNTILDVISEIKYVPNGIDKERFLFSMNDGNYVYVTISKLTKINEYKSVIDSVEDKRGILYLDYGNYFVPKEN
jgi:cell division septal protein FtsQ